MKQPFVFPIPQSLVLQDGIFRKKNLPTVCVPPDMESVFCTIQSLFPSLRLTAGVVGDIVLKSSCGYPSEAYSLRIGQTEAEICCSDPAGGFYGLITLCQLLSQEEDVRCCTIEDKPELQIRGVMLDISRGKVPTLDTLKFMADRLALFKINHLELYLEGLSFAYPAHRKLWENETPVTPDELCELNRYCRERFIDLVPCQNGLGHMSRWLSLKGFRPLAECPEGFTVREHTFPPTTLDPSDPDSLRFVEGLYDELLPCFDSTLVNACLDEPFELCMGKNRDGDKYRLYTDYANRLSEYLKSRGRRMMMWGDVIAGNEKAQACLDPDIMILDWGYEKEHPFSERAERLARSGRSFCLCPGTNSWLSFTGMTDNMLSCIRSCSGAARKYGAAGMIVTDWGDMGHLQYLPVSWAGILASAAHSWSTDGCTRENLAEALNRYIFLDSAQVMGRLALDAGNYYLLEEFLLPCRTLASTVLNSGLVTREEYEASLAFTAKSIVFFNKEAFTADYLKSYETRASFDGPRVRRCLEELLCRLDRARPRCADAPTVLSEYKNALLTVDAMCRLREIMLSGIHFPGLPEQLASVVREHRRLWNMRNKSCGCEQSLAPILKIREKLS